MELIKPIINPEYENMWIKCFYYCNIATNLEVRLNNSLFTYIKFRVI